MPQSRSKDKKKKTPSFFDLFSRLSTEKPKAALVINQNEKKQLEALEPPKKKGK